MVTVKIKFTYWDENIVEKSPHTDILEIGNQGVFLDDKIFLRGAK